MNLKTVRLTSMNLEQRRATDIVIAGHNLLILGSAGTGKSFLISHIAQNLREKGKRVQITCSTGIACHVYNKFNEHACTVHQFLGLSDGRHGPDNIVNVISNNRKHDSVIDDINNIETLIVDECSMISLRIFETILNVCTMKNPDVIFGGIQVIFCGDFFQLPPVANTSYGDHGEYCFQSDNFRSVFIHKVVLCENFRQSEQNLIKAIKDVYSGLFTMESENFILSLSRPLIPDNSEQQTLKLFSRNDLADDYNRKCLLEFQGIIHEFKSNDQGKAAHLTSIPAPHILWLKIGCPVILLKNLTRKLVNGLQGYLKELSDEGSVPVVVFPTIGVTTRISKAKFTVFNPRLNTDIATRHQFPLKPAFGLTIHKAQGMTLSRVEVDCKDIFKAGQLGVAMSRATTSSGLRIINFHPRYVMRPQQTVMNFMQEPSAPISHDLTCCNKSMSNPSCIEKNEDYCEDIEDRQSQYIDLEQINCDSVEHEDFDDEFNRVIASIVAAETEAIDFEVPEGFIIENVLEGLTFKKEVTETHTNINRIINIIDKKKMNAFVKKVFLKLADFLTNLTGNKSLSKGIPEKNIAKFYHLVHSFCTSAEYRLDCLMLMEAEDRFSDDHMIVCYGIVEEVRHFYLKQKVDLMKVTNSNMIKRHVTNASRARIRYVAGYCLASLRKKYVKQKKSNTFSCKKEGQDTYIESKSIVNILNLLKEDEHYLKSNTDDPESLVDIERKQYESCGLTNVTDSLFKFFLSLTEKYLDLLVMENLMKYGKEMYNQCLEHVLKDQNLYEQFVNIVITCNMKEPVQDFEDNLDLKSVVESMVIFSSQTCRVFHELIAKYLMVLLAQFRKDVKSSFRIEKTMAHRKQIKVSKQCSSYEPQPGPSHQYGSISSHESQPSRPQSKFSLKLQSGPNNKYKPTVCYESQPSMSRQPLSDISLQSSCCNKPQATVSHESQPSLSLFIFSHELQSGPNVEAQPNELQSGPSYESLPGPSPEPSPEQHNQTNLPMSDNDDPSDLCQICLVEKEEEFIQCDSCDNWFHRKCAGLKNVRLWKKFQKKGAHWYCKACK